MRGLWSLEGPGLEVLEELEGQGGLESPGKLQDFEIS